MLESAVLEEREEEIMTTNVFKCLHSLKYLLQVKHYKLPRF